MAVPPKPKRMSEKKYRELYDSDPQFVEGPGFRYRVAGLVSADVVASTYRRQGVDTTIRPATEVMSGTRRFDGQPETDADRWFFHLRESGYTGPIDQDGNRVTSGEGADILRRMAEQRGGAMNTTPAQEPATAGNEWREAARTYRLC